LLTKKEEGKENVEKMGLWAWPSRNGPGASVHDPCNMGFRPLLPLTKSPGLPKTAHLRNRPKPI